MKFGWKIFIRQNFFGEDNFQVVVIKRSKDGVGSDVFDARENKVVQINEGTDCPTTLTIDRDVATRMMNSLWELGLRPSSAISSSGQVDAMKDHIKDLRDIITNKMGKVAK